MAIEINHIPSQHPKRSDGAEVAGTSRPRAGQARDRPAASAAATDEVHLSESARLLARLGQEIAAEPEFDAERVDRIRQAIEDGAYPIDAERLASKIVELEIQLGR